MAFIDSTIMPVSPDEPFAANILRVQDVICVHANHVKTRRRIAASGFTTVDVDISEFLKAEAGLTCLSVICRDDKK